MATPPPNGSDSAARGGDTESPSTPGKRSITADNETGSRPPKIPRISSAEEAELDMTYVKVPLLTSIDTFVGIVLTRNSVAILEAAWENREKLLKMSGLFFRI